MDRLISVIVTTFERDDALDAVLRALSAQRDRNFEVLVADDGSGPSTAALMADWGSRLGVRLHHVWHPHNGFRAGEIRNRAVREACGEYFVFLDGDCLPRSDFVAAHRRLAEADRFVAGNRVLLSEELTKTILQDHLPAERWPLTRWFTERLRGRVNSLTALVPLPLGPLRGLRQATWEHARSCNLGVWRSDFERVDGFDARFNGWGREDSDLLARLIQAEVRRKDGFFATGVLHLWHPSEPRDHLQNNDALLADVVAQRRVRAVEGLSSLADEAAPAA